MNLAQNNSSTGKSMPRIFALSGRADSGKTTTLKKLRERLISHRGAVEQQGFPKNLPGSVGVDVLTILQIEGQCVGIVTQGDVGAWLNDYLQELIDAKCDTIVCATRTRGATVAAVQQWAGLFSVIWRNQTVSAPANQYASNTATADWLASQV